MDTNGGQGPDRARDTWRQTQEKVVRGVDELRSYAEVADASVKRFARERPFLAIACALGIGFIVGHLASRA
ncbi:MAG TPA: hypothetical protein VMK12_08130 [Anaeromyxobacteraceae bacterium]|nr:hypothetical protein [Anaeromyxobacteraceae bacterium]